MPLRPQVSAKKHWRVQIEHVVSRTQGRKKNDGRRLDCGGELKQGSGDGGAVEHGEMGDWEPVEDE
jgi:hypothetical protein